MFGGNWMGTILLFMRGLYHARVLTLTGLWVTALLSISRPAIHTRLISNEVKSAVRPAFVRPRELHRQPGLSALLSWARVRISITCSFVKDGFPTFVYSVFGPRRCLLAAFPGSGSFQTLCALWGRREVRWGGRSVRRTSIIGKVKGKRRLPLTRRDRFSARHVVSVARCPRSLNKTNAISAVVRHPFAETTSGGRRPRGLSESKPADLETDGRACWNRIPCTVFQNARTGR